MLTLLGTIFGGLFRLCPEIMKFFDKNNERKHELSMLDKQMEADRLRGSLELQKISAEADLAMSTKELEAIIAATNAQGKKSGVRWIDGLSSLMRPLITIWWVVFLYTAAMGLQFYGLLKFGTSVPTAILTVFGPDEKAIAASIISFWFVDRSLRKAGLR